MKLCKRICALALCIVALAALMPVRANAADYIDTNRECRLNIKYLGEGSAPLKSVQFELYRVAAVSATNTYTPTGNFSSYPITLNSLKDDGWRALATTLQGYVAKDGIVPYDSGMTNTEGRLSFPNRKSTLRPGLYLLVAKSVTNNGKNYSMVPTVISLPAYNSLTDDWNYTVEVQPKYETSDYSQRRVVKVWDDNDYSGRPSSVKVSLMKDNKVHDTVVLNKANNWRYTWKNLDPNANWTMVEENVPYGYSVAVTRDSFTFYVTNSYSTANGGYSGGGYSGGGGTGGTAVETLPQTGQLWWPVPVMAVLGLGFICCGELLRRRNNYEK